MFVISPLRFTLPSVNVFVGVMNDVDAVASDELTKRLLLAADEPAIESFTFITPKLPALR